MPTPRDSEPLLFGDHSATLHTAAQPFSDLIARTFPGLTAYETLADDSGFRSKSASVALPGLGLVASAISPTLVELSDTRESTLLIPLHGRARVRVDGGRPLAWGAGCGSLYLPAHCGSTRGWGGERQLLMLQLDLALLEDAARAMRGLPPGHPVDLGLGTPRVMPPQVHGTPVGTVARHLGGLVDAYGCDPAALHQLGLQDFLYRQLVLLFRPDWFTAPLGDAPRPDAGLPSPALGRRAIDHVCDRLQSDLSRRATLTQMAQWSGLSTRGLQYAFQSRYGMSPSDWLTEQRLLRARERLQRGDFPSIAALSLECGFATPSRFSAAYKRRFGELPSLTPSLVSRDC
ncbi:MAG: AraC family transcriptional regulator [Roseateles sp.]|uniref:helix-turn-helix domain-containing protein n=1 Tax=Roseateles sp. TaxID=1971397 RepID=UPI0039E7FA3A